MVLTPKVRITGPIVRQKAMTGRAADRAIKKYGGLSGATCGTYCAVLKLIVPVSGLLHKGLHRRTWSQNEESPYPLGKVSVLAINISTAAKSRSVSFTETASLSK
jgi:hypothetical protein